MHNMHTMIEDPLEMRKQILESALNANDSSKAIEAVTEYIKDEEMFRKELKMMMKTLKTSVNRLENSLPPLPEEFKKKKEASKSEEPRKKLDVDRTMSRHEKFASDMEGIRERIRHLEIS